MSPDGAYWFDGKTWQPMPKIGVSVPAPPAVEEVPLWVRQARPSPIRSTAMVASVALIALMLVGVGAWAWYQSVQSQTPPGPPLVAYAPDAPLTANFGTDTCPVAHPGDTACFKGTFTNSGPAIGKLAIMFVRGGSHTDWLATHPNGMLSKNLSGKGCELEASHSRIVCGSVPQYGQVVAYMLGIVTVAGTYNYGVRFADIATGEPVYVNQPPKGAPSTISWTETTS